MRLRVLALVVMVAMLGGVFAVQRMLDDTSSGSEPSAAASRRSSTAAELQILEQRVRDRPDDVQTLTRLALLHMQRARQTGDPSSYGPAGVAFERATALAPDDVPVLVAGGALALAKHDFERALALGERARAADPDVVASYAVIADALIELGRYEDAAAATQEMIDRRPDFASYSRASYLRELYGDLEGAIELMDRAAASAPTAFDSAWALVIVGNLHLQRGGGAAADRAYARAQQSLPDDPMVRAAHARIAISRGDLAGAEALLRSAVEQRPLPEYAIALGELLESQGKIAEAEEQYALVRATQQLFAANGVDTDLELALFDADHGGDPELAYERALAAYARRPGIYAADTLAWAAHNAGRIAEARRFSDEALRLGTKDPRLFYHAGVIAQGAGDAASARAHLRRALDGEAAQSVLYAVAARDALDALTASASHSCPC